MDDQKSINRVLEKIDKNNKFYIDIGCGGSSNIPQSCVKDSTRTIFCEPTNKCAHGFSEYMGWKSFTLVKDFITPDNVIDIFSKLAPPEEYGNPRFVDLDIDGYDYFVLEKLLTLYTPSIIMTELNEKIPPPVKFTVKYIKEKQMSWDGTHFYGCSISKYYELLKENYDLIDLSWNNAFWVRKEMTPPDWETYTDFQAHEKFYSSRNWKAKFQHNNNVSSWLEERPLQVIELIKDFFKDKHIDEDYELYI